ncbi:hypothetical protein [Wenjunlia tyrosinilytica]|jgi:hypothetical protein|uniref:Uncharacterized protein n=1 Tax=Wenjunlia tyrosinilytica TaxID=1544741 RepID=A0A917ZH48_9ACTN|nr:hypothetical protein [Wenjunlia tyrosinilytica]GGO82688.1 hypothetical protein GCM10012280_09880 [Wenjunlia tyrosinilytica]
MAKEIKHTAGGKYMTFAELEAFVRDANATGATGKEILKAEVTIGGKLKKLAVDIDMTINDLGGLAG